ncbi:DNA cytosine methyltransferase [Actinomadura rudentiformis]|uniref:DNA (cytosine-5-)-methyltransferase n=1 Tax=Actinomadura rudentiformis TaxID=359158 RepID=A0A6H9Z051_9ACTN|nr:DNA cytosine methyltransferase [Actinomadura rudentiformis]KAB2347241.1 DNA cytosine methyltransferase [Actinomadura rudentiformis]
MGRVNRGVSAIDLFCGVGGLSHGLQQAGVKVVAGFDIDPRCKYPFETNIDAAFLEQDVRTVTKDQLNRLWEPGSARLLAGCAPCQPFSPYRRGQDTSQEEQWSLLEEFGRLVQETLPDLVTMENVPRIVSSTVFKAFVDTLKDSGYEVSFKSCYGPEYGLPQHRRRLVLIASLHGLIKVPDGEYREDSFMTVRDVIFALPEIASGGADEADPLHKSRSLSEINLHRIRASRPGGTWRDWPEELRAPCHRRASGATFKNVYARMEWDKPAPTITTMAYNFGTGRFGHPEQDRAISLREAAILQGFPPSYRFVKPGSPIEFTPIGRLIGNAVPPAIAAAVGKAILTRLNESETQGAV